MRDYLDGLVERTVDRDSGIRPRLPSIFEPRQPLADADAADETPKRAASVHTVDMNAHERQATAPPPVRSGPVTAAASDVRSQTPPAHDDEQLTQRLAALERMARHDKAAQADVRRGDGRPARALVPPAPLKPTQNDASKTMPHPEERPRTTGARSPRVPEMANRTLPRAAPPEGPSSLHRATPPARTTITAAAERSPRPAVVDAEPTPKHDAVSAQARHEPPALMPRAASMRPVVDMRPRRQAVQPSRHTLVQVTIGRVDVRAEHDTRPQPSSRVESGAPATLDDYMRRRHGAAR